MFKLRNKSYIYYTNTSVMSTINQVYKQQQNYSLYLNSSNIFVCFREGLYILWMTSDILYSCLGANHFKKMMYCGQSGFFPFVFFFCLSTNCLCFKYVICLCLLCGNHNIELLRSKHRHKLILACCKRRTILWRAQEVEQSIQKVAKNAWAKQTACACEKNRTMILPISCHDFNRFTPN